MQYVYTFILAINIIGFFLMGYDKLKSKNRGWRIPEINLFLVSLIGGAAGVLVGMKIFRHKTRHSSFVFGIPFIFVINLIAGYLIKR